MERISGVCGKFFSGVVSRPYRWKIDASSLIMELVNTLVYSLSKNIGLATK